MKRTYGRRAGCESGIKTQRRRLARGMGDEITAKRLSFDCAAPDER
jgi:hypothetical protein